MASVQEIKDDLQSLIVRLRELIDQSGPLLESDGVQFASQTGRLVDFETLVKTDASIEDSALELATNRVFSEADMRELEATILKTGNKSLPNGLPEKIERKYGLILRKSELASGYDNIIQRTKSSLSSFQSSLFGKATASLAWGLAVAFIGLVVLSFFIYNFEASAQASTPDKVFYYFSRLGFVAIIETVAIFFLRQYRIALDDEKYISNEITNIGMKINSLKSATQLERSETMGDVLSQLSRTERNFSI